MYICHIFFICSSFDGHLGWLHNLAIVSSAAMNMGNSGVCIVSWLDTFEYILRSVMAGSCDSSILNYLKNLHTDFQSGTNLWSQSSDKGSSPPHPLQHFLFVCFLDDSHWGEIESQCSFVFPFWLKKLNFFHMFIGQLYFFIWKMSAEFICPFNDGIFHYFDV
jgi:hypothetical protein